MKKSINEKIVSLSDNSFHDKIISCVYLNDPEIDVFEYTTEKIGKKLSRILFFEGIVQEQLQDGSILDVEVGCRYFVNLNTMRREVHRVILNMDKCRPMLLSRIYRIQTLYQNLSTDIVDAITETEKKTFAEYFEANGINGLRDYILEVEMYHVSTRLEGTGETIMRMEIDPLAIEQRIALRDELICQLNSKTYKNNSVKVKYVKAGVNSARIELNWFR